ncbi:MAG: TAXI family TRAP transporter solute-binding subunit, partial [Candidatus Binatia bacterium]
VFGNLGPDKVPACSEVEKKEGEFILATSQPGGTYLVLGGALEDLTEDLTSKDLKRIKACHSSGSVENIGLLAAGEADFAIVQSDVAHRAWHLHKPFNNLVRVCEGHESNEKHLEGLKLGKWVKRVCKEHDLTEDDIKDLKLVTPLHTEKVHVLVRPHLHISSTSELKGKEVALGPEGSGSALTAQAVLEASGLSTSDVKTSALSLQDATQQLGNEKIDAAFWTGAVPTPLLDEVLEDSEIRLIRLERKVIDRLEEGESYVEDSIPKESYTKRQRLVPTVAVKAFLLARGGVPAGAVDSLVKILKKKRSSIQQKTGVKLDRLGRQVDKAVLEHKHVHSEVPPGFVNPWDWPMFGAILLAVLVAGVLTGSRHRLKRVMRRGLKRFIRRALSRRDELLLVFVVLILIWALGSAGLYYFERDRNEQFESYWGSVWAILVYVAGGFEARIPLSAGGEFVAVMATALGIALVAWVVPVYAVYIIQQQLLSLLKGRPKMPADLKDHIVVVNWDERTNEMIRQLHGKNFPEEQKKHIVVVSETGVELPEEDEFEEVTEIIGNPMSKTTLNRAAVQHAHSVTVLSAWPSSNLSELREKVDADVADTKTIMAILAIRE